MYLIREATTADVDAILQIAEQTWWPTYEPLLGKEQVAYMLEKILNMELSKEFMDATDGIAIAICHHYHANTPAAASTSSSKKSKKGGWGAFVTENPGRVK